MVQPLLVSLDRVRREEHRKLKQEGDYHLTGMRQLRMYNQCFGWAIRSRLDPIKKVARMRKPHQAGLLSYFRHRVTNALTEGFNSRMQSFKSAARGLRKVANYRLRTLFYCGKIYLMPKIARH